MSSKKPDMEPTELVEPETLPSTNPQTQSIPIRASPTYDISDLKWTDMESSAASVKIIHKHVLKKARDAGGWYQSKKNSRKRISKLLQLTALLTGVAGGLVPLLQPLWTELPSNLGYVLIGLSAALLFANRFLGISSGWIRFVQTELLIQKATESFEIEWAQTMASMNGRPANPVQLSQLFDKLKHFATDINQLVEQETNAWAAQFDQDLELVEKSFKGRSTGSLRK